MNRSTQSMLNDHRHYIVVTSYELSGLIYDANELMATGEWEPVGGVTYDDHKHRHLQAFQRVKKGR